MRGYYRIQAVTRICGSAANQASPLVSEQPHNKYVTLISRLAIVGWLKGIVPKVASVWQNCPTRDCLIACEHSTVDSHCHQDMQRCACDCVLRRWPVRNLNGALVILNASQPVPEIIRHQPLCAL